MKGSIASINISDKKGQSKVPVRGTVMLRPGWGIVGDVHGGTPDKEVSLLPLEALGGVSCGGYGENIDTKEIDILDLAVGTVLKVGESVQIQITGHGKLCPSPCSIYHRLGGCIMQEKGIFAAVLEGGEITVEDKIEIGEVPVYTEDIDWILENCKRIAVVGVSPKADRPSHWISKFLLDRGYEVIPIRPGVKEIFGQTCFSNVKEVPGPIDLVLIFRRAEEVPPVVEEAMQRGVKAIWMQEGIVNPEVFQRAKRSGLKAVMDRCIYKELKKRYDGR